MGSGCWTRLWTRGEIIGCSIWLSPQPKNIGEFNNQGLVLRCSLGYGRVYVCACMRVFISLSLVAFIHRKSGLVPMTGGNPC